MANKKLKSEVLKHFKEVGVVYDKKAFSDFFKDFAMAFVTDNMDLTKKKNKKDFDMLKFTIILLFEEHEHLIRKLEKLEK